MTKKSLSDLLKEEVNKADAPAPAAPAAANTEEKAAPQAASSRRASRSSGSARRTATSRKSAKAEPQAAAPAPAVAGIATSDGSKSSKSSKSSGPSKPDEAKAETAAPGADLAQRVNTLEKDLAAAQTAKAELEKTVVGLQTDLKTQQERLFELKDSLDQANAETTAKAKALAKTQAELEEAKQTILKLAEAPAPDPVPAPAVRRISGVDITPRRPVESKSKLAYSRGVPGYAVQTEQPNPMLTDADIGWVD